jgi:uncharacterized damage-inducible protein DinB
LLICRTRRRNPSQLARPHSVRFSSSFHNGYSEHSFSMMKYAEWFCANWGEQMTRANVVEARLFHSWQAYQDALVRGIAPLSDEQMSERLVPGLRSVGEIAEHIVYGRALWLTHVLGTAVAEVEPLLRWDEPDDPPHSAAEVVQGLDLTWRLLSARLRSGAANDAQSEEETQALQILWGMLDHDLPHIGELSFVLGGLGLPGVVLED